MQVGPGWTRRPPRASLPGNTGAVSVAEQQAQVAGGLRSAAKHGQRGAAVVVAAVAVTRGLQTLKVEKCHVFTPPSVQFVGTGTRTTGEVRGTGGTPARRAAPYREPAGR